MQTEKNNNPMVMNNPPTSATAPCFELLFTLSAATAQPEHSNLKISQPPLLLKNR